ncbi:MAG: hypothetical protein BMS9Abin32_500 [Gammaproteobacteria bacterium]|nr:MAG: hypothetical protein BMS9Abin32_500 [Gammaproteobacteria bacterium]
MTKINSLLRRSVSCQTAWIILLLPSLTTDAAELPQWVQAPPQDSAVAIYGVGEGKNRDLAKSAALAAIAGSMMTKVEGSTSVNQRQDQYGFSEQVEISVKTKVKDIALSHYKVVDAKKASRRWWVLVELDRSAMFTDALTGLDEADLALTNAMVLYSGLSRLEQYLGHAELRVQLDAARAALELARSVGRDFRGEEYAQRYQNFLDQVARSKRELAIRVNSDELANQFSQKLVNLLTRESIRAYLGRSELGNATIKISGERKQFDIGQSKMVKMTILLTTSDERGRQLVSIERSGVGESLVSYESALTLASNKLARECEAQGIRNCLGL